MNRLGALAGLSSLASTVSCAASPTELTDIKSHHQKTIVGYKAIDDFVKSGDTVGLGTGSTTSYAMKRLAEKVKEKSLTDIGKYVTVTNHRLNNSTNRSFRNVITKSST